VAKTRDRLNLSGAAAPLKQSLSGLASLRDRLPPGDALDAPTPPRGDASPSDLAAIAQAAKLVVRRERKGHGGKTATRIEGLVANAAALDSVMRDIKRALGCGATVDGNDIIVQGDQIDRLVAHLRSRGAKKVISGN